MAQTNRQDTVLNRLRDLPRTREKGPRQLFADLNYDYVGRPLSNRAAGAQAGSADLPAEAPILFAAGGDDGAFHVINVRLAGETIRRGEEGAESVATQWHDGRAPSQESGSYL